MMISKNLSPATPNGPRGHSAAPMQPQPWQLTKAPVNRPILRTASPTFRPRILPPVNLVKGSPRLYG